MSKNDGILVKQWKKYALKILKRRFGNNLSTKKLEKYLDRIVDDKLENPTCHWVNNYKQAVVSTDALSAIDSIEANDLIMGGAAATYMQHAKSDNPMIRYIDSKGKKRSFEKKKRAEYERGTENWARYEIKQLNTKTLMNSLYGVLGYQKFIFHNIFLAESITRMGRVIIATAACGFEDFLCDNVKFTVEGELYEYVNNILEDYDEKYKDVFNFSILDTQVSVEDTTERLLDKCAFPITAKTRGHVMAIVSRAPDDARLMLYYRNNFMKFNRIPIIKDKIMKIIAGIPELKLPELESIQDEHIRDEVEDLWRFYECFVYNEHPIYDSVRKMAYGTRKAVLYIDTDSNFISLYRWVHQIRHEFFEDSYEQDSKEFVFICANILTIFLSTVVDKNLKMYATNCHIDETWRKRLSMKNEFFFWRIIFGDVKKRYIDLQMIQEGKILNDGKGLPEIKGYDFRKFTTKDSVRNYYTEMCLKRILTPDTVDLRLILKDIDVLKRMVRESMQRGESEFFKQANVNSPDHYATPLRISGIKGVMLWAALAPEYAIELPADVDLIPIKNLNTKKMKEYMQEHWPEQYKRLEKEIYTNRNPEIAKMALTVIAKPKNSDIAMPDWLRDIMDTEKIVNSTVKLIHPVIASLGPKIEKPTASKEFLTNLVDL